MEGCGWGLGEEGSEANGSKMKGGGTLVEKVEGVYLVVYVINSRHSK